MLPKRNADFTPFTSLVRLTPSNHNHQSFVPEGKITQIQTDKLAAPHSTSEPEEQKRPVSDPKKRVGQVGDHLANMLGEHRLRMRLRGAFLSSNSGPDEFDLGVPSGRFVARCTVRLCNRCKPVLLSADRLSPLDTAVETLLRVPSSRRGPMVRDALAFLPGSTLEESFDIGQLRAALATFWEEFSRKPIPVQAVRKHLLQSSDDRTVSFLNSLAAGSEPEQLVGILAALIGHLNQVAVVAGPERGPLLFESDEMVETRETDEPYVGGVVSDLQQLLAAGRRFATIYADPPWAYDNDASRGAAVNHYPVMSLDEICREPVAELASDNAHLHLSTTNTFLREAFDVIHAWGFTFKSCFVWIKDDIGMGNYWRVSHEFLCDRSHKNSYVASPDSGI